MNLPHNYEREREMKKNFQELVQNLLENNPELRDNDLRLVANIWWMNLNGVLKHRFQQYELDSFKSLLEMYAKGDLPNEQSIRRVRRKIQEENPNLRGSVYEQRHQKADEFRDEIMGWDQGDIFDD